VASRFPLQWIKFYAEINPATTGLDMKTSPLHQQWLLLCAGALVLALPATADLLHRYSFNESPGSTTAVVCMDGSR
jgi:hypothetical protein